MSDTQRATTRLRCRTGLRRARTTLLGALLGTALHGEVAAAVPLAEGGRALATIVVPDSLMDSTGTDPRRRLRRSVVDLARYLGQMSGAAFTVSTAGAAGVADDRLPILVGESARQRFGPVRAHDLADQGHRVVVTGDAIGLYGESDLASSYAVYELLHQLGCRWYVPSDLGAVIPRLDTVAVAEQDLDRVPYTLYRTIWYKDDDYARRNRMGGLRLNAGHALEGYITPAQLEAHPGWKAVDADGEHHGRRLRFSAPGVAEAIADCLLTRLDADPQLRSISLSPDDGLGFDARDDRRLDAGDYDPAFQDTSITDRLIGFANRIADRVTQQHPDVLFGLLAYVNYTRPPVRERVHASIVPQVAPISYARAHPMTDPGEPNNPALRALVQGWGAAAERVSYYFYGWFLAEASAPQPFITKWGVNIPIVYAEGGCRLWQPETIPNFESNLHGLYMGLRLAWDPAQDPAAIVDELHTRFYAEAAAEMAAYWHYVDSVWVGVPEYAGAGWGHMRRWTPERLDRARQLLDAGRAAAATPAVRARVEMAHQSLALFEDFMALRRDLAEGRFADLAADAEAYRVRAVSLGERYAPQYAFAKLWWTRDDVTLNSRYFRLFYEDTYRDAWRIAHSHEILTETPLRSWRYHDGSVAAGRASGWADPSFDDGAWSTTDACVDTWSALGYHNYLGAVWYRTRVELPAVGAGDELFLWLAATDGTVRVFVNGEPVEFVTAGGGRAATFGGYAAPVSVDITAAARSGTNQIVVVCDRQGINEVGASGLLGPAVVYRK